MTSIADDRRRFGGVGPPPPVVGVGNNAHFAQPGQMPGQMSPFAMPPIRSVGAMAMGPDQGGPAIPKIPMMPQPGENGGGGVMDRIRAVGEAAKDWGPLALAGLSAYEGHQASNKQEEMTERAIREAEERKAMVRRGRERRSAIQPSDYSDIFASDNPYRRIRSVGGG